jgi:hypothetical protein
MEVQEPTVLVFCRWLTPLGGMESLFMTQHYWLEMQRDNRLRYLMPPNSRLSDAWGTFIEHVCNNMIGGINHPFTLIPGVKVSAWGLANPLPSPLYHGQTPKYILALASVAQACMSKRALMIGDVPQRNWGRLTNWCKAHIGSSSTQKEREERRGGRPAPDHDSDVEMEAGEGA